MVTVQWSPNEWTEDGSEARLVAAAPLPAGTRLTRAISCLGASYEQLLLSCGPEAVSAAAAAGASPWKPDGCSTTRQEAAWGAPAAVRCVLLSSQFGRAGCQIRQCHTDVAARVMQHYSRYDAVWLTMLSIAA